MQPSLICKSQDAGNHRRCLHTTPKQNSQNAAQSHDSKTESDKRGTHYIRLLILKFDWNRPFFNDKTCLNFTELRPSLALALQVERDIVDEFIDREGIFTTKERRRVRDLWYQIIQERVNLLRFREILAMLFDEGQGVFQGKGQVKFVKLVTELNKLADETEAQQT